jgi:dihydrofolate reductase
MIISMIAAMSKNRVIGKDNDIPWHLPDDFTFFKETTAGHFVIMGRKNWESLPHRIKPLPNRTNVVITRQKSYKADGAEVVSSLEAAIQLARNAENEDEAFIIGGGEIYRQGLDYADTIYLTEINAEIDGDVKFPEFSKNEWQEVQRTHHSADERHAFDFDFVTYKKKAQ